MSIIHLFKKSMSRLSLTLARTPEHVGETGRLPAAVHQRHRPPGSPAQRACSIPGISRSACLPAPAVATVVVEFQSSAVRLSLPATHAWYRAEDYHHHRRSGDHRRSAGDREGHPEVSGPAQEVPVPGQGTFRHSRVLLFVRCSANWFSPAVVADSVALLSRLCLWHTPAD
jgi:hypothetical protein